MTDIEKLQLIRVKCVKRIERYNLDVANREEVEVLRIAIASLRSTIAAIDSYLFQRRNNQCGALSDHNAREREAAAIITAWEGLV